MGNHTPNNLQLQQDPELFLQRNPVKLNFVPRDIELSETTFEYATIVNYEF